MAQHFLSNQMVPKPTREKQIQISKIRYHRLLFINYRKLLKNAISFAKKFSAVSDNTTKIILNARKSLLFNSNNSWMKKTGENFDVAMGLLDGAEICELVGLFHIDQLASVLRKKMSAFTETMGGLC